jgi:hypothetical protein
MSLLRWIWQLPPSESEWTSFIISFFYRSLLLILLMMGILLSTILFNADSNLSRLPTLYSLLFITLVCLILLKRGYLRAALHSFIWLAWAVDAYSAFTSIGVYTPAYLVAIILIMMSGLGLSRRTTILFTSIVVGLSCSMGIHKLGLSHHKITI